MTFRKCPKLETYLELVSIPEELGVFRKMRITIHKFFCEACREKSLQIQKMWRSYFSPEPDITPSLMYVFKRLQKDETLILKGWKLNSVSRSSHWGVRMFKEGWFYRGAITVSLAAVVVFVLMVQWSPSVKPGERVEVSRSHQFPVAKIRQEEKNRIRVQYVQPELMHSVEFETTGASGVSR